MNALTRSLVALAFLAGLAGCAPTLHWTKTTSVQAQPRVATCSFELLTTRPDRAFDELGIIDIEFVEAGIGKSPTTAAGFLQVAQPQVCAAGGEAVLAEVNGAGRYIRGTVIRFRTATAADTTP